METPLENHNKASQRYADKLDKDPSDLDAYYNWHIWSLWAMIDQLTIEINALRTKSED